MYAPARATCLLLAPAEAGATAACRCSFVLVWQRTCLLAPRHLSHVLVLQTPVSVKSITDYHNFVPPDKAICIGNIQSKVGSLHYQSSASWKHASPINATMQP